MERTYTISPRSCPNWIFTDYHQERIFIHLNFSPRLLAPSTGAPFCHFSCGKVWTPAVAQLSPTCSVQTYSHLWNSNSTIITGCKLTTCRSSIPDIWMPRVHTSQGLDRAIMALECCHVNALKMGTHLVVVWCGDGLRHKRWPQGSVIETCSKGSCKTISMLFSDTHILEWHNEATLKQIGIHWGYPQECIHNNGILERRFVNQLRKAYRPCSCTLCLIILYLHYWLDEIIQNCLAINNVWFNFPPATLADPHHPPWWGHCHFKSHKDGLAPENTPFFLEETTHMPTVSIKNMLQTWFGYTKRRTSTPFIGSQSLASEWGEFKTEDLTSAL